ncbi:MAG TPA: type II toxin-antitoxin system RelE/ParE family toxin [Thermoanaerobaculia bacterium]|nr:type II toxin-antitoxin system RelE/ParE family toxin [Thermoanaerobaculia bacterium]
MKRRLVVRPLAKGDLDEQARYIARDNVEAALRLLDAAEAAFDRLRSLPEIGKAQGVPTSRAREGPLVADPGVREARDLL